MINRHLIVIDRFRWISLRPQLTVPVAQQWAYGQSKLTQKSLQNSSIPLLSSPGPTRWLLSHLVVPKPCEAPDIFSSFNLLIKSRSDNFYVGMLDLIRRYESKYIAKITEIAGRHQRVRMCAAEAHIHHHVCASPLNFPLWCLWCPMSYWLQK